MYICNLRSTKVQLTQIDVVNVKKIGSIGIISLTVTKIMSRITILHAARIQALHANQLNFLELKTYLF